MSDELQPVVPAESEDAVEQSPVAEVAAPDVEAADSQEVLDEVQQAKVDVTELLNRLDDVLSGIEDRLERHGDPDELVSVRLKDGHPDCMIPGGEGFVSGVVIKMTKARLAELSGAYFIEVIDENREEGL